MNITKAIDRFTKAGLVASAVPVLFCAFVLGPSATSLGLVEDISQLSSHLGHSLQLRVFILSFSYPLFFLLQSHVAKVCVKKRKEACALLIAWSGLVTFLTSLFYIDFF
ncbi:hypothetical protein RB25_26060 [Herbaspirillum rubrisubalbicans]|uniref:Uncharacterized protein n=1 Tax=Herbaspirillum rubrisubalbicans TaxID=80842 RepID=A0ABX9BUY5_9BURK|nr:hypothetical protein RB24_25570 [Herbaspirillum rubrisubalbicans]RAN42338.1 hypothetical protein RB25_26060 [Herbaspirillum rubrisubalbicans]